MANDAKFNFYVNRQGPRGQKGEKGDQGFSPSITVNTDTADEYTLLIQNEYDSFVTDNIRPTYDDRGGTYVRVDRTNNVQYFGSADIATTANYGEVKLAQASDLASTVDVGNSNVITVELLKTWFDGQLADNLVTTTNNVTIQGQKIFATPTRFMDTVRIGNRLMVTQDDTGTITFDTDGDGTLIGTDATFKKDVRVYGGAGIDGNLRVNGATRLSGNTSIFGTLDVKNGLTVQTGGVKIQGGEFDATGRNTITQNLILSPGSLKRVKGFSGYLYADTSAILPDEFIAVGDERLPLRLVGTKVTTNGKDIATADTVEAIQSDLNIAKQDIIEAQGDIDNLQMNKQNKLTAGSGITIDADNVISATGGVVDLPIASSTTLGGIKVGENLTISEDGTLSATGGSGTTIDDSTTSGTSTWSSSKINSEINTVANEVVQVQGDVAGLSGDVSTLSGKVTAVEGKTTDLESAVANKQNKLTAGQGIGIDQSTNTISSTTPITYLTRAQYDALVTKDTNTMYVITDEEGGGGTSSDAPVTGVSAPLKLSGDTVYVPEMTGNVTDGFTVTASRFSAQYSSQYYKCFNADGNGWYAGNAGSGSDYIQIVFPRPLHLRGASIKQNHETNSLVSNYTLLITQNGTDWTEVLSDKLPQTTNYETSKIINSNCLGFRFRADGNYATNGAAISGIILDLTELPTTATLAYDDNFELDSSNQLSLNSAKFSKLSSPILDVPVNNCVLAMPTAPTFDGTNVKVYAGTKVAIANGLNADGTCKSNIVTLTADATINQSTFNGDVTLMLKSDGTIDQTAYSYFEVDDISTVTTLTAYCWYYDRKTNNHYLASSTGAKQGPYQRIKIGSYNQAEAATTKYFETCKPIALEKLDITGSCMPDYTAGVTFTRNANHIAPCDGVVLIFANLYGVAGGSCYMTINGVRLNTDMGGNSAGTYSLYFPVAKGDTYNWTDVSVATNNNYTFYPLKGAK